jgi:hypothetical protein
MTVTLRGIDEMRGLGEMRLLGTPSERRQVGRAVRITAETPDLVADIEEILPQLAGRDLERAVELLNLLAEYGWSVDRMDP